MSFRKKLPQFRPHFLAAVVMLPLLSGCDNSECDSDRPAEEEPRLEETQPEGGYDRPSGFFIVSARENEEILMECFPTLVEKLANRKLYDQVTQEGMLLDEDALETVGERLEFFKAIYTERLEKLMGCREGNEKINMLAAHVAENPYDRDTFIEMFLNIIEAQGSNIKELYEMPSSEQFAKVFIEQNKGGLGSDMSETERKTLEKTVEGVYMRHVDALASAALQIDLVRLFNIPKHEHNLHAAQTSLKKDLFREMMKHVMERNRPENKGMDL